MQAYHEIYTEAQQDPEGFWLEQAKRLEWFKQPTIGAAVKKNGLADWFPDGEINASYLALDAQINAGRGDQDALIYDSPVTGSLQKYTFNELKDEVAKFAGVIQSMGVEKGDRHYLHAYDTPGGDCDAGVRPRWRDSFGGIWRFCRARVGHSH